jgi:hypothetical protein
MYTYTNKFLRERSTKLHERVIKETVNDNNNDNIQTHTKLNFSETITYLHWRHVTVEISILHDETMCWPTGSELHCVVPMKSACCMAGVILQLNAVRKNKIIQDLFAIGASDKSTSQPKFNCKWFAVRVLVRVSTVKDTRTENYISFIMHKTEPQPIFIRSLDKKV